MAPLLKTLRREIAVAPDRLAAIEEIRAMLHELSEIEHPVDFVRWVPIEDVEPNDYNPNAVARTEMGLLLRSIEHDGYTQPVVAAYDPERKRYVIIDGFHRYFVAKTNAGVRESTGGRLPVVVIEKDSNERRASTIRHNRARGKHSVKGMSAMVFQMLENGMSDAEVCNELGMEPEEILRLKHITGFSKLFADMEYRRAWVGRNQILAKKKYEAEQAGDGASPAKPKTKRHRRTKSPNRRGRPR